MVLGQCRGLPATACLVLSILYQSCCFASLKRNALAHLVPSGTSCIQVKCGWKTVTNQGTIRSLKMHFMRFLHFNMLVLCCWYTTLVTYSRHTWSLFGVNTGVNKHLGS